MPRAATIGTHGVEPEHGEAEAADFADHVLGGHAHVGEHELAGVDAAHAHLPVDRTDRDALELRSTMKAVIESCRRLDGSPVFANTVYQSAWTTPDIQHFDAVQHPAALSVGVGRGPGPHADDVAAGAGLGQPEAGPSASPRRSRAGTAAFAPRIRRS